MRTPFSTRLRLEPLVATAAPSHSTATTDAAWDAAANEGRLPSPLSAAAAKAMYAWYDASMMNDGMMPKSAAKLPHHMVGASGEPGAASTQACSAAIGALNGARGGAKIPAAERQAAYNHLARHLRDAGVAPADVPPLQAAALPPMFMPSPAAPQEEPWAAVLLVEGQMFGDRRFIQIGAATWRPTPLSLMLQTITDEGHDGAVICGRIDSIDRVGAMIVARGVFLPDANGAEAYRLVDGKFIDGISIDGTGAASVVTDAPDGELMESFSAVEIVGSTITPFPACADARIALGAEYPASMGLRPVSAAATLGGPPLAWFADPLLERPTPLTVTDQGEVMGHLAQFGVCHRGITAQCMLVPRSSSGYREFCTGTTVCADGSMVRTAVLTMGCGHASADPRLSPSEVRAHYDGGPGAVVMAAVTAGEDEHGIWVHGWILPGRSEAQITEFRSQALSGDWRVMNGRHELIAAVAVPVPGYPIAASAGLLDGEPHALIAAGIVWPGEDCGCDHEELEALAASVAQTRGESELLTLSRQRHGMRAL